MVALSPGEELAEDFLSLFYVSLSLRMLFLKFNVYGIRIQCHIINNLTLKGNYLISSSVCFPENVSSAVIHDTKVGLTVKASIDTNETPSVHVTKLFFTFRNPKLKTCKVYYKTKN